MKKLLSIVLSLTLVVGLLVGMPATPAKADGTITVTAPANGAQVDLLSGNILEFCKNYQLGRAKELYKRRSDTYFPSPVSFAWNAVSGANEYFVMISINSNMLDATSYGTPTNSIDVGELNPGQKYYYKVTCKTNAGNYDSGVKSFTTSNLPKTLRIDSVGNTRDLGGQYVNGGKQRVRFGRVIRGANVNDISEEGKQLLRQRYGIKFDLDLRDKSKETVPDSSPLGTDIKFINIKGVEYNSSEKGIGNPANYDRAKSEILLFADPNNFPIYVHCQIGRDRTGTICFLIESLLGMNELDMFRDYELSYFAKVSNDDLADPDATTNGAFSRMVNYLRGFSGDTMQQKVETYMKQELGITDAQIQAIKDNMLTPLPKPTPKVVKPGKVTIKSAKNVKKKTVVVKYKKATNAKGYQVWWATSKKFKKAKKKFTKNTNYKIKKLKKRKKYYIKVRAYNLNGKTKVYGAFSKVKKVKIKK
ncbi:MAG: tyrosine-protein phosphatase [Eubacterium sp.]|nr:tyrosine-protein phosphatase [Eubacterium sp.]